MKGFAEPCSSSYAVLVRGKKKRTSTDMEQPAPKKKLRQLGDLLESLDTLDNEGNEDDEVSDDSGSETSKSQDNVSIHSRAEIPYELPLNGMYGNRPLSTFIHAADEVRSFNPTDATSADAPFSALDAMTTAFPVTELHPSAWSLDQPASAEVMNDHLLRNSSTASIADYYVTTREMASPEPGASQILDTSFDIGTNCETNTMPMTNADTASSVSADKPKQDQKKCEQSPREHGIVHFILTLSHPSADTMHSLMRIAIESQARFRVERE